MRGGPFSVIIGIDQGTTGTLGILMDLEGAVQERIDLTHQQIHPRAGWVEHDPMEIWNQVEQITRELAAKAKSLGKPVLGLGLANQGETVMAWDRRTSEPVGPAIVWQDTRSQAWIDGISKDTEIARYVLETTGLHLDSYFSASKMRWMLQNIPTAQELVAKEELCIGTLDAWMIWKFTGGREFATDASTAARTQLMSLEHLTYNPRLLELFEVPLSALPPIVDCDTRYEINGLGKELDGLPIAASLVDQPAAVFGHACLQPGQSKATYGTGCFVYLNSGEQPPPVAEGLLSTLAWSRKQGRVYALDGGVISVASIITWLQEQLGMLEDPREIDGLLAGYTPNSDITCVTAHGGLGSPIWDRNARGAWLGLDLATRREDLIYSVLEGIAFRVSQVIDAMEAASGNPISTLRVDGGLSNCNTLMQLQADLLQKPVEVVEEGEATAWGIAAFAARSLGLWDDDDKVATRIKINKIFTPQWNGEQRERRVERQLQAQQFARAWGSE